TYMVGSNWTEKEIINMLLRQFDKVWQDQWNDKAQELGMNIREIVTLASIIEKEAVVNEDRPVIAGVFYNRLAQNMKLQSCATVQYILGKPKNPLLYSDLKIESPYNTYLNPGLPPGPIA
ncbi:MAG: endolytic transglycosylase MltG, partial [Clostridiales bacterium]